MEFYCELKKYKSLKFTLSQVNVCQAGTHCPPAIHFFEKIRAIFELLYFHEFEADLYETSHFAKFNMVNLRTIDPVRKRAIIFDTRPTATLLDYFIRPYRIFSKHHCSKDTPTQANEKEFSKSAHLFNIATTNFHRNPAFILFLT